MTAILDMLAQLQFDLKYEKIVPNNDSERIFHGDVIDFFTGWRPNRSSMFLRESNKNIFHDNRENEQRYHQ